MATATNEISDATITDLFQMVSEGKKQLRILTIGKTGTGKSTLVNSILGEKVFKTNFGANVGTTKYIQDQEVSINGVDVHVYDTRGFFDDEIDQETIIEAISEKECDFDIILVCIKFGDRFDIPNRSMFHVISRLTGVSDIWKKVAVALTHADAISPDLEDEEINEEVKKEQDEYVEKIHGFLRDSIRIGNADAIPIILTSHPKAKSKPEYLNGWLPNLLSTLAEYACAGPRAIIALASLGAKNTAVLLKAIADKVGMPIPETFEDAKLLFRKMLELVENVKEMLDELKSTIIAQQVDTDSTTSTGDKVDTITDTDLPSANQPPPADGQPSNDQSSNGLAIAGSVVGGVAAVGGTAAAVGGVAAGSAALACTGVGVAVVGVVALAFCIYKLSR